MSLTGEMVTVAAVVIVFGPILGLIAWRVWRGEARFHGFWLSPSRIRKMEKARREAEDAPPDARHPD